MKMALFQEKYHTNFMKTKDLLQNFKTNNKLLFIALTTIILVVILYILISSILSSIESNKKLKTIKGDYQYVLSSIEEFEKSINYKSEASTLDSLLLELAKKYSLVINVGGIRPIPFFSMPYKNFLKYKTLISQEMLKNGFLASNLIFTCIEHNKEVFDSYKDNLDRIFKTISDCENGLDIDSLLEGPVCHSGFKRLN